MLSIATKPLYRSCYHSWCKWDSEYSVCINDYSGGLFLDIYDASPFSIYFYVIAIGFFCYVLRQYVATKIIFNVIGKHLDDTRKDKCVTYLTEFILLIIVLTLYSINGSIAILWDPKSFENLSPSEPRIHVTLYNVATMLVVYMYVIEMCVEGSKIRWYLKMHHMVTCIIALLFTLAIQNTLDFDIIRMQVMLAMYFALEPNVFFQLLFYRISPDHYVLLHFVSTIVYIITRILIIAGSIIVYISWLTSDFVQNELFNDIRNNIWYFLDILVIPILNILLNIAQWYSIQALIYISKRVMINNKIKKNCYPIQKWWNYMIFG